MGKSRIGNGLILAGLSGLIVVEAPYQWQIAILITGFIVGFAFPNF